MARPDLDLTSLVAGAALIVVGILLLLDRLEVIALGFEFLWPLLLGAFGLILLVSGLRSAGRGRS